MLGDGGGGGSDSSSSSSRVVVVVAVAVAAAAAAATTTAAAVVFCANREVSSGFFPSFLWYPPVARGREKCLRGVGRSERKSATSYGRVSEGESVTPPSRKKKREMEGARRRGEDEEWERERARGSRFVPSSWPGTTEEALSRGCSFGQCLLFLPRSRSLPPSPSFSLSLARSHAPSLLALFPSLPLAPRSLSSLPPPSSTPVLHRAHETRVPAKSLCHLANERPSAARIIPRRARSRKISWSRPRRTVVLIIVVDIVIIVLFVSGGDAEGWGRESHGGDPAPRVTGNIVRPENERERGAFGNVLHT